MTKKAKTTASKSTENESNKIAKTQMVDLISERTTLSKKQSAEAIDCVIDIMIQALKDDKSVGLPGLGTLSITHTAARMGVRPGTNERIEIPAGKKVRFKIATTLKSNL